jgi:hypothetical protein
LIEMAWFGKAPLPSTTSWLPFSWARLTVTAASAVVARTPTVTSETAITDSHR